MGYFPSDMMDDLLLSPSDAERTLAARLRAARKRNGWTQAELARRSGLGVATVARFERSGQAQVASLVRMMAALGRLPELDTLLRAPAPKSLAELRQR